MKSVRIMLLLLMVMMTSAAEAQTTTVRGVLKDSLSLESEPYATVRVFRQKDLKTPVATSITDIDGRISMPVTGKGRYVITLNSVGRKEVRRVFTLNGEGSVDLGTLLVIDDSKVLQGVEVVAQKPLVKMDVDKMTYNVQDDADAKASTVLDMLRKVPMVTVDGQDNITVNGSSAFKVYVDGKPNMMMSKNPSQIFKAMPASVVKNIEVVTNPGAKYDAEGVGGVLNIIMNKETPAAKEVLNGVNGNVRLEAGNREQGGGVFINGQQNKLSFSADVMVSRRSANGSKIDIVQEQLGENNFTTFSRQDKGDTKVPFSMFDLNLGYEIDSMSTVNVSAGFNSFNIKNDGRFASGMKGGMFGDGFEYGYLNRLRNKNQSISASADYQRFLNKDRTSSITLTYQFSTTPSNNDSQTEYYNTDEVPVYLHSLVEDRKSLSHNRTTDHTVQADYTVPLSEKHTLNAGMKYSSLVGSTNSDFYLYPEGKEQYMADQSMHYRHTNDIGAIYAEYEGKIGKIGTKAGLRYEQTWQHTKYLLGQGENFSKNYGNLVPSLSLSYSPVMFANLGLTYNMRISRPGISYLNPYVDRSSTTVIKYGNTGLDVEKSHNMGFVANVFTPKFMASFNLRYALTPNAIEQYSFYKDNILNTTYGNIVRRQVTSTSLFMNWMLAKNTRLFTNAGLTYNDMKSNMLAMKHHAWQWNVMAGLQQTLPWDMKFGAYYITSSKRYTLQGWSTGFNILTANLSKSLLSERLTIALQGITGLSSGGNLKLASHSESPTFRMTQDIRVPMSGFTATITYNFGNKKVKTKSHESRVKSDVMEQKSDMMQMQQMQIGGQ